MDKIIFSLFDNAKIVNKLTDQFQIENGIFELRLFPDNETYIRIESNVKDKFVFILCFLDHPNNKILSLYFLAKTLRELGANKIALIVPYLPYMRQDKEFKTGEAVTSNLFAQLLSSFCDSLLTIDPHLHRIKKLSDIYLVPITVLHTASTIAKWLKKNVKFPLIIGPDEESSQWVSEVARLANAPYAIATKKRLSDKRVIIDLPNIKEKNHTPIIVDDIISSGTTMRVLIECLLQKNLNNPICIGIHALFNQDNYKELINAGAKEVISCNTIFHPSNQIDIFCLILDGIKQC